MLNDASNASLQSAHRSGSKSSELHHRRVTSLDHSAEEKYTEIRLRRKTTTTQDETSQSTGSPKAAPRRRVHSCDNIRCAAKPVSGQDDKGGKYDVTIEEHAEINNDLEFGSWYEKLENGIFEADHKDSSPYLNHLKYSESSLDRLLADTSNSLDLLVSLSNAFENVETQTTVFQKRCEGLLTEQTRLEDLASRVEENLQNYLSLEPISRKLNAPSAGTFVQGKDFSDMLARLDECIAYMRTHPSQNEAQTYQSRYQQLLTRGLTLVRVSFINTLKEISTDVTKRIADKQLNDTTMSTLLYAKFRVGAAVPRALSHEIHRRANSTGESNPGAEGEYQSLMNELYIGYGTTRGRLIMPMVKKRILEIAMAPSSAKDIVVFARSSIGYIQDFCSDEYDLWWEWFEGFDGLYEYLDGICEPLYDELRPRIIHENHLLKLCELCTYLQTRYFKEQDDEFEPVKTDRFNFVPLVRPALEDAQTRLVFRALAILRNDIESFKPKPADLEISLHNQTSTGPRAKSNGPASSGRKTYQSEALPKDPIIVEEGDADDEQPSLDYQISYQGWYPTLQRAIWLLSRIYRLVNSTVFDDLAYQIVHQTTLSLQRASSALTSHKAQLDGQLFLLRNLLILKQQIVAFDIEYITPDVTFDFSGVASTFYELRDRGGLFDPRALWRLVSGGTSLLPRVVANMLDAKAELDGCLRAVIHDLCVATAGRITAAVPPATVAKKTPDARHVVPAVQAAAAAEVPLLRQKLEAYLDDMRTRETLVGAVRDQVILNYEVWHEQRCKGMRGDGRVVSTKGKGNEDDVWEPGALAHWAADAFWIRRGYGRSVSGRSPGVGSSEGVSIGETSDDESIHSA